MQITKAQNIAAGSIVELITAEIGTNGRLHPGTAIASGGRLAGSFMFRSFNFQLDSNITPGSAVLSEEANEKGPVLINVLGGMLDNFGISPDQEKMDAASNEKSDLSFLETLQRLQDKAQAIMKQNGLDQEQMAYCCAMATAFFIKEFQNYLPAESGFHTAVYGFIEGCKTCPPAFGTLPG